MKIIVAPDSFKGSMTSVEAGRQIKRAILDVIPETEIVELPMADGGEGTVEAVLQAVKGEMVLTQVLDPIGREIQAGYGWLPEQHLAVIETAAASGLTLLKGKELDPHSASTFGTGQLIGHALLNGAKTIILGLGGSATVDGGVGIMQALGMKAFDILGNLLDRVGGELWKIGQLDFTGLDARLAGVNLIIASDVTNPLLGDEGAIRIFGPQKGVHAEELERFEAGMTHFARLVEETTGREKMSELPGSGAAGGIGFLLRSVMNVEFKSGLELVLELANFERHLPGTDLIITGEGKIDSQSSYGKVPVGIARIARGQHIPVIAFAGIVDDGAGKLEQDGVTLALPIIEGPMTLEEAMAAGPGLLYKAVRRFLLIYGLRS
ncbi:glycerate kinase [Bacillus tianshenii]|uniref:glycerate kinase n=1 Tax=Sutcliffiella tianshenii TaxID=1463404 RepID=UPI001CD69184|nr:glycerate kinase [Bacillus tianshenii]MCA1318581.1 glycerate kinase [Bacillus tianshenii]